MTILTRSSYAAGHFEFRVDGLEPTAYVKSVEGGWSRAQLIDGVAGANAQPVKQIGSVDIEPITVEFGLGGAKDMLKWIQGSWNRKDPHPRNGQITYADFDMRAMFEHHFYEALLTDTIFPTLDGVSKEGGYIKCKLQPARVETTQRNAPGPKISSNVSPLQKMWTPAAFRLNIDGIDEMKYVNKIDTFTVTLGTKKLYTGASRFPQIVPLKLTFPNITGTISFKYADKLLKWHQDYIRSQESGGIKDADAQKSGSIEFLSPDRKQTLLQIKLSEVGLVYVGADSSKANEEAVKRLKFELYVHGMSIEGSSTLGFV